MYANWVMKKNKKVNVYIDLCSLVIRLSEITLKRVFCCCDLLNSDV